MVNAWLQNLSQSALNLVFPLECAGCGEDGEVLCPECVSGLARLEPPFCPLCADPGFNGPCPRCAATGPVIDGVRAPFLLEDPLRKLVHRFKYQHMRAAAPALGQLLADFMAKPPGNQLVLVPVPLHPRRMRGRGYNQAALLARELSNRTGLAVNDGLLHRLEDSRPQVESASSEERVRNVAQAFGATADAAGLRVLLLDDIVTTGSTLFACAAALKEACAAKVWGLALAKEPLRSRQESGGD